MLRTNLATRPFYNERAVYMVLGLIAVLGLVVLAAGVVQIVDLARRNGDLTARADAAARATAELTTRTTEIQRGVSPQALEAVSAAAREANTLIDQRVFSWTDFFNRIETTLPADVMLTEVRPNIAPGSVEVTMGVIGRRLDAISEFVISLEESGAFAELLNRQAELTEDGMYRATLRGRYLQARPPAVAAAEESVGSDDGGLDAVSPGAEAEAAPDRHPGGASEPEPGSGRPPADPIDADRDPGGPGDAVSASGAPAPGPVDLDVPPAEPAVERVSDPPSSPGGDRR